MYPPENEHFVPPVLISLFIHTHMLHCTIYNMFLRKACMLHCNGAPNLTI